MYRNKDIRKWENKLLKFKTLQNVFLNVIIFLKKILRMIVNLRCSNKTEYQGSVDLWKIYISIKITNCEQMYYLFYITLKTKWNFHLIFHSEFWILFLFNLEIWVFILFRQVCTVNKNGFVYFAKIWRNKILGCL